MAGRRILPLACVALAAAKTNEDAIDSTSMQGHNFDAKHGALRYFHSDLALLQPDERFIPTHRHLRESGQKLLKTSGGASRTNALIDRILELGSSATLKPTAIDLMDDAVADLIAQARAGATPADSSVKSIKDMITNVMLPKVMQAHKDDKQELANIIDQFKTTCGAVKKASAGAAQMQNQKYTSTSPLHKSCRAVEASFATEVSACNMQLKAAKQIKQLKCRALEEIESTFGSQSRNVAIVTKSASETVENYIERLSTTYCGTDDKVSMFTEYKRAQSACNAATAILQDAEVTCRGKTDDYKWKKAECDSLQMQMDNAACERAVLIKDSCEGYAACYTSKLADYDSANKTIHEQEQDRKNEYRALKRIGCLIDAFAGGVTDTEVKACKAKTWNTDVLNIVYPSAPSMDTCSVPDLYPSTGAYKKAEFAPLPTLAKGDPEANECQGVLEISTTPKPGSPGSCKCERVTMNGPYAAGPMVRCTNCWDVYKSLDKDSCPIGTKIFSPRSRADWATFLASATPLRDPNWIIDITRPQNGCGGCKTAAMNSVTTAQKSWVTSDGSAWWLRAAANYNEPNGDYTANCYLDLWHRPVNEDQITWNDMKCTYHSKSYYCQKKQMSLTPKVGSPPSCKCSEIALTGKYSPGSIVKCTQCLDVRRSLDKNSCPAGTKLFSPRSREDWQTFIQSAAPLRSPNWIIDVTRPQNGCGGCTSYPMHFQTPQQTMWKTSDKSAWWLRSTTYNEPNGDYQANCYLDLWQTPKNADFVTFNDHNCNYHAHSYYCQPTLAKAR